MSQIDAGPARLFFADFLIPLRYANTRRLINYLNNAPEEKTYWKGVASRTGGLQKLSAGNSDGTALIDLLAPYWLAQNDPQLPKLLPHLQELRREIVAPRPGEGTEEGRLPEFTYVLF